MFYFGFMNIFQVRWNYVKLIIMLKYYRKYVLMYCGQIIYTLIKINIINSQMIAPDWLHSSKQGAVVCGFALVFKEMLLKPCAVAYNPPVHSRCAVTCGCTWGLWAVADALVWKGQYSVLKRTLSHPLEILVWDQSCQVYGQGRGPLNIFVTPARLDFCRHGMCIHTPLYPCAAS